MNTLHHEDRQFLYWLKYCEEDALFEFFEKKDTSWKKWRTKAVMREIARRT